MTVIINGTTGVTSVNGSAAAPSVTGTDTDTGIVYGTNTVSIATGGVERLQVDSSGNVAIGTTPGSLRLELSGASAGASFNALRIGNTDTTASSPVTMFFLSADDGTARNRATIASGSDGSNSGYIALSTRSSGSITEKLRLNSTGAVVLAGGTTTADGTGITFPATQSASTNANTLDDYEEGTWTPAMRGSTTAGTYTGTFSGTYTKVGRLVTLTGICNPSSAATGGAGYMQITGLPFTNLTQSYGSLQMQNVDMSNTAKYWTVTFITGSGTSTAYISEIVDNANSVDLPISSFGTSSYIAFSLTYQT